VTAISYVVSLMALGFISFLVSIGLSWSRCDLKCEVSHFLSSELLAIFFWPVMLIGDIDNLVFVLIFCALFNILFVYFILRLIIAKTRLSNKQIILIIIIGSLVIAPILPIIGFNSEFYRQFVMDFWS